MASEQNSKPKLGFTIIKNDPTDGHKGFGIGSLSLENISPVIIDVEAGTAQVEMGAMHARMIRNEVLNLPRTAKILKAANRTG